MRPGSRAFDAPTLKKDIEAGLAAEVARRVSLAKRTQLDIDDASKEGGTLIRLWLEDLVYDTNFVREVNNQIGGDHFNSEFFLDGLFGGEDDG